MVLTDATDLFVLEEEPLVDLEDEFGSSFFILLRNFALNSSVLRPSHQHVLSERVLGFVNRSVGFAELYAMTDRSGSRTVNFRVSAGRLTAVQRHLLGLGAPLTKVMHPFAKAIGEDFFKNRFDRTHSPVFGDGRKDGQLRLVVIALTPAPIGVPTKIFRTRAAAATVSFCRRHQQNA